MKKLPKNLVVADLGSVLEIETEGQVWTWPRRANVRMLWHEPTRSIVWFDAKPHKTEESQDVDQAAAKFAEFTDRDATRAQAHAYDLRGHWQLVGPVSRIDYNSNKWGENASYTHKLGRTAKLYSIDNRAFCIQASRLRITPRGIEG